MIRKNDIISLAISLTICLLISISSCHRKQEEKRLRDEAEAPAAKATQAIATPTLALPPPKEEPKPEEEPKEGEPAYAKPRGPITLPPPEEKPLPPEMPSPEEIAEEAPPAAEEVPLATLEKGKEAKLPEEKKETPEREEVQALAAPSLPPAEPPKPEEAQQIPYSPKLVTAKTNIDIVLDASGSMAAPFGMTSQSKFDMLREALYDIIYEVLQQQPDFPRNLAIRLFGSESPAIDNNCEDSKLIAPMGEPDLGAIRKILDEIKPKGTSPIAFSLSKAVGDFPLAKDADRVIVLVADGSDNCGGDPCREAANIAGGPNEHIVHVVAFDVGPADQEKLECVAKEGGGRFFLARNNSELRTSLNEAINSTVPYNLKLSARAGATPLPFNMTVYTAGTEKVVKREKSVGTKLVSLNPGTYDILIEYAESPETRKPSKILKGVEILATTRVEQTVNFDLGELSLSAISNEGKLVPAKFEIIQTTDGGRARTPSQVETGAEAKSIFLTPGTYDVIANLIEAAPEGFSLVEEGVKIETGKTTELVFRFQKGTLALKGVTTQNKEIPFLFQTFRDGKPNIPVVSGAFMASGGDVYLAPGKYDLLAMGIAGDMVASPRTKVSGIEIKAAEKTEVTIKFEMGTMTISAVDGRKNKIPAEFVIRDQATQLEMARLKSESGAPVSLSIPPGSYDIVAVSLKSTLEPRPSVLVTGVEVTAKKPTEKVIEFILGTLRLRGRNSKEGPIRTQFTIYKSGSDEMVSGAEPSTDWIVFDISPGFYDALAINMLSDKEPKPMIWLRDIKVEDGKIISHEAIFTDGKIKIMGRGPNNQIIICKFKVFEYGADRELISGVTGDDWEIFEIQPGKYYLEASYYDEEQTVTLKKWINISIGDNEVVEQLLRF